MSISLSNDPYYKLHTDFNILSQEGMTMLGKVTAKVKVTRWSMLTRVNVISNSLTHKICIQYMKIVSYIHQMLHALLKFADKQIIHVKWCHECAPGNLIHWHKENGSTDHKEVQTRPKPILLTILLWWGGGIKQDMLKSSTKTLSFSILILTWKHVTEKCNV